MVAKKKTIDMEGLESVMREQGEQSIVFSQDMIKSDTTNAPDTPYTATGRVTHMQSTLVDESRKKDQVILDLEAQLLDSSGKGELISTDLIDPKSHYHNRSESMMDSPENLDLYESIAENGNIVPILIREHQDKESQYKYQIIAGHCRFEGCRRHGKDISAMVTNVDDRDLIIYRLAENIKRSNPAAFDTGVLIDMALDRGEFANQREFSEKAKMNSSTVSRYRAIASFRKPENKVMYAIYKSFDNFVLAMTEKKFMALSPILKNPGESLYLGQNLKSLDTFTMSDDQRMEIYTDFGLFNIVIDTICRNEEITEYLEVIKIAKKEWSDNELDLALEKKNSEDAAEKDLTGEAKSRQSRTIFKEHVFGDIKLKVGVRKNSDGSETIQALQFDGSNQKQAKYIIDKLQDLMRDFEQSDRDLFKTAE